MKPLLVLARITFVGCLWSIIFVEGIRVIMLENWRFDIFWPPHWAHAWNLWLSGWVIDTPKEWAFVLIILTFIPLWLTGWIALSLIPWEKIIWLILSWPYKLIKGMFKPLAQVTNSTPVIVKKKSYKEVRPTSKRVPIYEYTPTAAVPSAQTAMIPAPNNVVKEQATQARETLNHAIFDLDDEDEDFDLDIDSFDKSDIFKIDSEKKNTSSYKKNQKQSFDDDYEEVLPKKKKETTFDLDDEEDDDLEDYEPKTEFRKEKAKNRRYQFEEDDEEEDFSPRKKAQDKYSENRKHSSKSEEKDSRNLKSRDSIQDILEDKGYDILHNIVFKKTTIDYLAISSDKILLCMVDKEQGDWLADEERFNDEEPLWFSENSHRISPVRRVDVAARKLDHLIRELDLGLEVEPYVIIAYGNIINAEDMLDVWEDIGVKVVRIGRGSPTELKSFVKVVEEAEGRLSRRDMDTLKKALKKLV